jgi:hypothetical protein
MAATLIPNLSLFNPLNSMIGEDLVEFEDVKSKIRTFFGLPRPKWKPLQSKHFFKTYSQIDDLFSQSPTQQLALIVKNSNNRTSFTIDWIPSNPTTDALITTLPSSTIYFIFSIQMYNEISNKISVDPDGAVGGLCALIGKDGTNLFLYILRRDYVKRQVESGGGPPYAGARVPTT